MLVRDHKIRIFIVLSVFIILFFIIIVRLFLIQIHQKNFFKHLAQQQHELEISCNQARGIIYDRTKTVPLAFNHNVQSAFIIPNQLIEPKKIKYFLEKQYPDVYKRTKTNPDKQFLWLDRKLSKKKYLQLKHHNLKDIHFLNEPERHYPFIANVQLIGIVDIDNAGTAGLELEFTHHLEGTPTNIIFQKDARSGLFYFNKVVSKQGKKAQELRLTIDNTIQTFAYEELKQSVEKNKAKSGSCIVMDANTGDILAITNYPSYNPHAKHNTSLDTLKNNAICECYELGSVMKVFCALAAFEEKVVDYDEIIDCEGRFAVIDGVKVENPTISLLRILEERNNKLPFCDVLRYSSNVGIAKIAKRLGPKFYTHLRHLGFGSKTGIEFPGEREGFINPPHRWSRPSAIVMSFGYEMMISLIQLAKAFSIIANGGFEIQPTLIYTENKIKNHKKIYKDSTITSIKNILERVCEKITIKGYHVMGKTGTARCVKDGHYSTKHHNYSFAGIIEKDEYRRVIVTFIKEPERASLWASEITLPIFSHIAQKMVVRDHMLSIQQKNHSN